MRASVLLNVVSQEARAQEAHDFLHLSGSFIHSFNKWSQGLEGETKQTNKTQ